MKNLWAPWRLTFIVEDKKDTCIFCEKPKENEDAKNLIFERRGRVFGMLNKYPYNTGHLMIAPYRHVKNIEDLAEVEWEEIFELLRDSLTVLKRAMSPEGFNIGFNVGRAAGAGYDHIHLHVVPRWNGDTNFMPVLSDTKVMPEHLEETYRKMRDGIRALKP
ncbi:MAG: HIT domain-containing protein [Candidatus Methanomethyliaceae archaeon]|nr:HIT domain-containing protein [Candidatus Methanomethyliaceae archaeon]